MNVVYSARYHIDIGAHVFPTNKYVRVADRIRLAPGVTVHEPQPASWEDLAVVHSTTYLKKLRTGAFDIAELAQIEIPWSPAIVEGFRLMTGGTILALQLALEQRGDRRPGAVYHVGGGFHHAFADHGEGFCLFNDVAVALRPRLADGALARAAVIDLDVHHGNGTAAIFEDDPRVFTFSMHQEHNYPAVKPPSSLDVGLSDGANDESYLAKLEAALPVVWDSRPDVVCYLAGADPYVDDQLGGLSLTKGGLRARDRAVLRACATRRVPVVILLAGGYARRIDDTVDVHVGTFEEALEATPRV